jgi:hypothetical protein
MTTFASKEDDLDEFDLEECRNTPLIERVKRRMKL